MSSERITAKRAALRLRITAAAFKTFSEKGFEKTNMTDVADQLQMTGPALYHYFATKNELLCACLNQILDQLVTDATTASSGTAPARDRLASVVRTQVAIELKYGSSAPLINAHLYGPQYLTELVAASDQKLLRDKQRALVQIYRELIAQGVEAGDFVRGDVKIAAFNVLAIIQYSAVWYRPKKGRKSADVIEAQVEAVMRMLGAPAPAQRATAARRNAKPVGASA